MDRAQTAIATPVALTTANGATRNHHSAANGRPTDQLALVAAGARLPCDHRYQSCMEPSVPSATEMALDSMDSARLLHCARRREHWLKAGSEATRALLADTETSPWLISARAARRAAGTTSAAVWLPPAGDVDETGLRLGAFDGEEPDEASTARMADRTLYQRIRTCRKPVLVPEGPQSPSVLVIPLLASEEVLGVLTLPTAEVDSPQCPAERLMIADFCGRTALACQLAQAQRKQRQSAVYADRDRIARDLHDQVIQQLFGAGLMLGSLELLIAGEPARRVHDVVERLDRTIADIRRSIFSLHIAVEDGQGLRHAIVSIALEAAEGLGFSPKVHLVGPLNDTVPVDAAEDVVAAVREGLSNAARHAHAHEVDVRVVVEGRELTVHIVDDGIGLPTPPTRRTGLRELTERAERRSGRCELGPAPNGAGAQLLWRISLRTCTRRPALTR